MTIAHPFNRLSLRADNHLGLNNMHHLFLFVFIGLVTVGSAHASPNEQANDDDYSTQTTVENRPYVFSWMDYPHPTVSLRGGSTTGVSVTLDTQASEAWAKLQADGLSSIQRDAAAILAMAGDYRATFDFLETEVYGEQTTPAQPYRSWGTERIYVLEHTETSIVLQHVMVMFMVDEGGQTLGPYVMKHWRQDWEYEPTSILEHIGNRTWQRRLLSQEERSGQWVQTVYQVDDSPRYALLGTWQHTANYSRWDSSPGWRPLPRREYSVRSDYHTLVGPNTITVLPRGWIHSQDNLKTVLTENGHIDQENPAVAREFGVNRYDQIIDFDFSAGDAYWSATQGYWNAVRVNWSQHLAQSGPIHISKTCDQQPLFMILFETAEQIHLGNRYRPRRHDRHITETLDCVVNGAP